MSIVRKWVSDFQTHLGRLRLLRCMVSPSAIAGTRSFSADTANSGPSLLRRSFVVSYLVNSCGLSPESANSVSERVRFRSSDNAESVLNLLRNNGFSETQITKLVSICPTLLVCKAETNLLPKLRFFRFTVGLSDEDLTRILSSTPSLLAASLEGHLIPCYRFFNNVVGLDENQVMVALKRRPYVFLFNVEQSMAPNIALLRELGVPQSSILYLVMNLGKRAFIQHSRFVKAVEEALKMGFDPSGLLFVVAVHTLSVMTELKWEAKFELFGRWGWSREQTLEAFRKNPRVMEVSEKKVMEVMDFLVNEMGWSSARYDIVRDPKTLFYSMEKRIIPRCYIVRVLKFKGFVKQDLSLASFLPLVEDFFLKRYVIRFQDSVLELSCLYEGKMNSSRMTETEREIR